MILGIARLVLIGLEPLHPPDVLDVAPTQEPGTPQWNRTVTSILLFRIRTGLRKDPCAETCIPTTESLFETAHLISRE